MIRRSQIWTVAIAVFLGIGCTTTPRPSDKEVQARASFAEHFSDWIPGGYTWPFEVSSGQRIDFFFSSKTQGEKLTIYRRHSESKRTRITALHFKPQARNALERCSVAAGCDWKSNWNFEIPQDWPSGLYEVETENMRFADRRSMNFVVKNSRAQAKILLVYDRATQMAYNTYGGMSQYGKITASGGMSERDSNWPARFSQLRPFAPIYPKEGNYYFDLGLHEGLDWLSTLEKLGPVDVMSNFRWLANGSEAFAPYDLVILPGMQEFISHQFQRALKDHILAGGTVVLIDTEYAYKSVRMNRDGKSYEYYSALNFESDPYLKKDRSKMAVETCMIADLEAFFGSTIEPTAGFCFEKKIPFRFVDKDHPYLKGMEPGFVSDKSRKFAFGWSMGSRIIQGAGKYCLEPPAPDCDNVEVIGYAKTPENDMPEELSCDYTTSVQQSIWGDTRFSNPAPEHFYSAFLRVRQGQGEVITVPSGLFDPNSAEAFRFVENVLKQRSRLGPSKKFVDSFNSEE